MTKTLARVVVCALLAGCAGDGTDADALDEGDLHDHVPADAELPEDAYAPLLPENEGEDAGSANEDALDGAVAEGDARVVDVALAADVARVVDASRPADVAARQEPPRCTGSASGQSSIWTCTADRRARQRCVNGAVQTEACAYGCVAQPSGTNDYCAARPTTSLPACARRALLAWGLHPDASDHLRCAGVPASRITQTIGSAPASAGTHARDGYVNGQPYGAATDLSTRGLSTSEIRALLGRLANQGFVAWYRWPGHDGWPSSEAPHIHAVYVGCAMKSSLRAQVSDWLVGRNGLASHTTYTFYTWTAAQRAVIRAVFERYN